MALKNHLFLMGVLFYLLLENNSDISANIGAILICTIAFFALQ